MRNLPGNQLFRSVATTISGKWHNFHTNEVLIFSPAEMPLDVCDITIIKDDQVHTDYYLLGVYPNQEVYILMGDNSGITGATIKVITNDTLIMQKPGREMMIYERRKDTSYADSIIAAL